MRGLMPGGATACLPVFAFSDVPVLKSLQIWLWATAICPCNCRMSGRNPVTYKNKEKKSGENQNDFLPAQQKQNSLFRRKNTLGWWWCGCLRGDCMNRVFRMKTRQATLSAQSTGRNRPIPLLPRAQPPLPLLSERGGGESETEGGAAGWEDNWFSSLFPLILYYLSFGKGVFRYPFSITSGLFEGFFSWKAC